MEDTTEPNPAETSSEAAVPARAKKSKVIKGRRRTMMVNAYNKWAAAAGNPLIGDDEELTTDRAKAILHMAFGRKAELEQEQAGE